MSRGFVALVDYNMPQLSGMEVMTRLAEMESAPPVIMLTGEANEQLAVDAMKHGAADYLVKDAELGYLEILPIVIEQVRQRAQLINDHVAILKQARESEERYRKLVELSPDGICVHSGGVFEFFNPAGAEMLESGLRAVALRRASGGGDRGHNIFYCDLWGNRK